MLKKIVRQDCNELSLAAGRVSRGLSLLLHHFLSILSGEGTTTTHKPALLIMFIPKWWAQSEMSARSREALRHTRADVERLNGKTACCSHVSVLAAKGSN